MTGGVRSEVWIKKTFRLQEHSAVNKEIDRSNLLKSRKRKEGKLRSPLSTRTDHR